MPTYEYACVKCGQHFDVFQSFSDEPLSRHEGCGGRLNKVLGSVGIVLKGSGFYKTDSRSGARGKQPAASDPGSTTETTEKSTADTSSSGDSSGSKPDSAGGSASKPGAKSDGSEAKSA